jgi:hypothetical protein
MFPESNPNFLEFWLHYKFSKDIDASHQVSNRRGVAIGHNRGHLKDDIKLTCGAKLPTIAIKREIAI